MNRLRTAGAVLAAAVLAATGPAVASAAAAPAHGGGPQPLPQHIFAPYFEGYSTDDPAVLSAESGDKYLTLAFIQTPAPGSCAIDWNGKTTTPIGYSTYGKSIAEIQARGGNVIPSFGGAGADGSGEEIADSCTDVAKIAADYEQVLTTYNVTRLDFDVEGDSESNTAGIDRRNEAIALVEQWAACHHRTVQFVYTLGTNMTGLDVPQGEYVLQSAVAHHANIDIVNIMTFDYYDGQPHEMGKDTVTAATAVINQLKTIYPHKTTGQLWHMLGITEMLGIDDYGPPEVFTTADGAFVENWAAKTGIAELSFWALERDNGGCVGTAGSDDCSGVAQSTWRFSHEFEPFNRW